MYGIRPHCARASPSSPPSSCERCTASCIAVHSLSRCLGPPQARISPPPREVKAHHSMVLHLAEEENRGRGRDGVRHQLATHHDHHCRHLRTLPPASISPRTGASVSPLRRRPTTAARLFPPELCAALVHRAAAHGDLSVVAPPASCRRRSPLPAGAAARS